MQFNIDGYPSDSPGATQYFGTGAEKLGVTMMLLQDTRRTEYSGTAHFIYITTDEKLSYSTMSTCMSMYLTRLD